MTFVLKLVSLVPQYHHANYRPLALDGLLSNGATPANDSVTTLQLHFRGIRLPDGSSAAVADGTQLPIQRVDGAANEGIAIATSIGRVRVCASSPILPVGLWLRWTEK